VLKKAGIVVATAAAGLLAVSPLAFAGDKDDHDGHRGSEQASAEGNSIDNSSEGLINVADNNLSVPVNVCENQVPVALVQVPVNDTIAPLTGALGLLGGGEVESENEIDDSCKAAAESGDSSAIDD
jgi:hypothetical protein